MIYDSVNNRGLDRIWVGVQLRASTEKARHHAVFHRQIPAEKWQVSVRQGLHPEELIEEQIVSWDQTPKGLQGGGLFSEKGRIQVVRNGHKDWVTHVTVVTSS